MIRKISIHHNTEFSKYFTVFAIDINTAIDINAAYRTMTFETSIHIFLKGFRFAKILLIRIWQHSNKKPFS